MESFYMDVNHHEMKYVNLEVLTNTFLLLINNIFFVVLSLIVILSAENLTIIQSYNIVHSKSFILSLSICIFVSILDQHVQVYQIRFLLKSCSFLFQVECCSTCYVTVGIVATIKLHSNINSPTFFCFSIPLPCSFTLFHFFSLFTKLRQHVVLSHRFSLTMKKNNSF